MSKSMAFRDACMAVLNAPLNGHCGLVAKAYAKAGLTLQTHEEMRSQSLYILVNLSGWRGTQAKLVKDTLKRFK